MQAFWSAGQRQEDSGDIEFYYRRISAVKQWKPLRDSQSKKIEFFRCPQSLPGVAPLTKKPEDSGYEIGFRTVSHLATAHSFCASRDARRNPVF